MKNLCDVLYVNCAADSAQEGVIVGKCAQEGVIVGKCAQEGVIVGKCAQEGVIVGKFNASLRMSGLPEICS